MSSPVETKRIRDHLQIQEGGGGSVEPMLVHLEDDGTFYTFDKTFGEVKEAFDNGQTVLVIWENEDQVQASSVNGIFYLKSGEESGSNYGVYVGVHTTYNTDSLEGYPTFMYNG